MVVMVVMAMKVVVMMMFPESLLNQQAHNRENRRGREVFSRIGVGDGCDAGDGDEGGGGCGDDDVPCKVC